MKMKIGLFLIVGLVLVFLFGVLWIFGGFKTGNVVLDGDSDIGLFVKCLNEKKVVMYGFSYSPGVEAQIELFGVSALNLSVIDCHENPEKCEGVIVFPSWNIDGKIISSGLSLGVLSDLTGCKI